MLLKSFFGLNIQANTYINAMAQAVESAKLSEVNYTPLSQRDGSTSPLSLHQEVAPSIGVKFFAKVSSLQNNLNLLIV